MTVRALLLSLVLLLAAAPAAAAQDALDEAAQALRDDTVYVDPAAQSDVDAGELRNAISERGVDVRVAVLPESAGNPSRLAPELAERVGEPGDYAVVAGNRIIAGPSADAGDAAEAAVAANGSAQAVLLDFVDRMAAEQSGGGDDEGGVGAGGLILLGLAGAGGAAVLVSRRRRRQEQAAELEEVKDNVRDDLVVLGDEIRALDLDIQMPDIPPEARADYETAVNAYDRANRAYETARRPEDLQPVGEALEEGRWAMMSARARLESREPPERRAPCFFDPRHGPSSREVEWAPDGGEPRMVPACEADAQRVERGDDPEAREMMVGGQRMPYWAAGPAYAPFMGGFYGGGLLPGLLVGTALGGMWDTPADAGGGGDWGGGDFGGGGFGGGDFGGGDF
jgi:hypothetical protein